MMPVEKSLLALLTSNADEARSLNRKTLFGDLTTVLVDAQPMRTAGSLTGGLAGRLEWTMGSMKETGDPDVVTLLGVNTVTTSQGTLAGADCSIWNRVSGGFVDYTIFTQGTGAYAGKQGTLLITGAFDPVTGTGSSNYVALLF